MLLRWSWFLAMTTSLVVGGLTVLTIGSRMVLTHPSETREARRTSMTPAVVPSLETATHKDRLRTRLQRSHSRLKNAGNVVHHSEWVPYEATAYSHRCIMPKNGIEGPPQRAANGKWPIANLSVAADPSLPFGTEIEVSHRGKPIRMVVHDRGRAIVGRKLDLFVESCEQAIRWGRKKVYVRILNGD